MRNFLLLLMMVLSCGWSCERGNMNDADLLDRDWVLSHIEDTGTGNPTTFPADAARKISILFEGESDAMYFTGVCNFGAGIYDFTSRRGEIRIERIAITEMACKYIEWESIAARNLQYNSGYKIDGKTLVIYSTDSHNLHFTTD